MGGRGKGTIFFGIKRFNLERKRKKLFGGYSLLSSFFVLNDDFLFSIDYLIMINII